MRARIYQPAKNAMQSGTGKTKVWMLEMVPEGGRAIDPLMGWPSNSDMAAQIKLKFDSREAAVDYAKAKGIDYVLVEPKKRKPVIRKNGYGENFATNRRTVWTH
ncbi:MULTISPECIES: ETC complex I subunit [Aliiruegeria]|uniref:NADH dehydrogenase n=1 Tax=Aliiruegeria lutimaris TaxID=571298 RepID=A0A1G8Y971_9RHOB|nr:MULTISPECIES: ETC complex I subunit [Aliiruegeria]NDR56983.1 ETC complex I subunit [Pseudoruegeria sp. M32A2M]SDJ99271.1 NADH dehydrogenase [Aliiruegeria lutimaris]